MPEASMRIKALAGLGLVCVQTTVGLLYKVSQKSGGFQFSTTSAIAIAEMIKLSMSVSFHIADPTHRQEGVSKIQTASALVREQVSFSAVAHIFILAFLYTTNNQLSFVVYTMADPGSIFLFKAASTTIVATIQCLFVGKRFSSEQWTAMFLQGLGMVIVQYNSCKGSTRYLPLAYVLMAVSTVVTAICAVRNEYLVKNYAIGLNVQNAILYSGGAFFNILAFLLLPNLKSKQAKAIGFFEGYSDPLALGVVFVNALIGLAITAVYKYADAVTKCIASDVTALLLCVISSFFFGLEPSVTMWAGVLVVCIAVHMYAAAPPQKAIAPSQEAAPNAVAGGSARDVVVKKTANGESSPKATKKLEGQDRAEESVTLVGKPDEDEVADA